MTDYLEGPLYVEVSNVWEEAYCTITNRKFTAYRTIRSDVAASKSNKSEHLLVEVGIIFYYKILIICASNNFILYLFSLK